MPVLQARVTDETKASWEALANRSGLAASELLRQAIGAVLAGNVPGKTASQGRDGEGENDPADVGGRVRLQFRKHELDAITAAAARVGWRRNTWIVSLVRSVLFQEPRSTDAEVAALHRSNGELRAIGRNLNQIAHALHRDDRYKSSVTVEKLDALRAALTTHVEHSQAVLVAAENRWRPPESFGPETL